MCPTSIRRTREHAADRGPTNVGSIPADIKIDHEFHINEICATL